MLDNKKTLTVEEVMVFDEQFIQATIRVDQDDGSL